MSASVVFCVGLQNIDQALVGLDLKLFPGILVLVGGPQDGDDFLLRRQRIGPDTFAPVRFAVSTILLEDWSIKLWSYAFNLIR